MIYTHTAHTPQSSTLSRRNPPKPDSFRERAFKTASVLLPVLLLFIPLACSRANPIQKIKQRPPAHPEVTISGIVTLVEPYMSFFMADPSPPHHGIYIQQNQYGPEIGDHIELTGTLTHTNGRLQITGLSHYHLIEHNQTPPPPARLTAAELIADLIDGPNHYEGRLVRIDQPSVTEPFIGYRGTWIASDGTGNVFVGDNLDYNYFPREGDSFNHIAGIVKKTADNAFHIQPRDTADLSAPPDILPHYALRGTIVTMDEKRRILPDAWLIVSNDLIAAVSTTPPCPEIPTIELQALILPALISTHDHLSYGLWDFIPFDTPPYFKDRNEWAEIDQKPPGMYRQFRAQRAAFQDLFDEIVKLVEVRMASSGCAVTQSQTSTFSRGENAYAKLGIGIINGERFPGRVYNRVLRVTDMGPDAWAEKQRQAERGIYHRFNIHLAETTDEGDPALVSQWEEWKTYESFAGYDTILHGINIPPDDYALFHHPNGRRTVLCWSPKSNMLLYNQTADIQAALDHGVPVALAPDWTPSGMPNMLAELNYAIHVAHKKGWNIEPVQYLEMLTRNAAEGFGQLDRMGSIEAGKMANLMIIEPRAGLDPYETLLAIAGNGADPDYRGGPAEVRLTIVAGRPLYGDEDLLCHTRFPVLRPEKIETLTLCGRTKKLALARHNAGAYDGIDELFNDFYQRLWERHLEGPRQPADFLPVDPCGQLPWL